MHVISSDRSQSPPPPTLWRTHLYVPAHDERKVLRAMESAADCVVLDLEDAVPLARKDRARSIAREACTHDSKGNITIRVNPVGTDAGAQDLDALASVPVNGFRLPKVEDVTDVQRWERELQDAGNSASLILLLESARGIERALDLARSSSRVSRLAVGEADLAADLCSIGDHALDYSRMRVVSVSRAAGLGAPIASVYTNLQDVQGLRESSEKLRAMGFFGRSVIHPNQIAVVADVFRVSEAEYAWAQEILEAAPAMQAASEQVALTTSGTFVDPAVLRKALWFSGLAAAFGVRSVRT